jgi:flagellar biosynthesis GTPase FlhF
MPSWIEKQKKAEYDLLQSITLLNQHLQDSKFTYSDSTTQLLHYFENNNINKSNFSIKNEDSKFSEEENIRLVINQNLSRKKFNLKLLLLGDTGAGKTTFKNLIVNYGKDLKVHLHPTQS